MPLLAEGCNLLDANRMTEGVHGDASLDATACMLVVACELILTESEVLRFRELSYTAVLANLCILLKPLLHSIRRKSHSRYIHIKEHRMCANV